MATFNVENEWHPKVYGAYVSYIRVSHRPHSRLSAAAQRTAVAELVSHGRPMLLCEFVEQEPPIAGQRPALDAAIALCKAHNAKLIFGQLHRMRGRMRWLNRSFSQRVKFLNADRPYVYNSNLYRIIGDEQSRRQKVSKAVKASLENAKLQGTSLGGRREHQDGLRMGPAASVAARQRKAISRDRHTWQKIMTLRRQGIVTLTKLAERLNRMDHPAPRGGQWRPAQVRLVIKRFEND